MGGRKLNERLISFVACDVRSDNVMKGRNSEVPVYFGDAGSAQVLSTLGAKRASCAVVALDSPSPPSPPFLPSSLRSFVPSFLPSSPPKQISPVAPPAIPRRVSERLGLQPLRLARKSE